MFDGEGITTASFGQRVLARSLDGVLISLVAAPTLWFTPGWERSFLALLIGVGYEGIATQVSGATVGKVVLGTRIQSKSRKSGISVVRAASRFGVLAVGGALASIFDTPMFTLVWVMVIVLPAMFDVEHRGLHDRLMETIVVSDVSSTHSP